MEILCPCFPYSPGDAATVCVAEGRKVTWACWTIWGSFFLRRSLSVHRVRCGTTHVQSRTKRVSWCQEEPQKPLWLMRRAERFSGNLVLGHCKVLQQRNTLRWGTNTYRQLLSAPEGAFCPEAALCGSNPALCKMIDSQSLSPQSGSGLWACCRVSQETTALACLWKADAAILQAFLLLQLGFVLKYKLLARDTLKCECLGIMLKASELKVISKISQIKSVKLRFIFSQDKRSHGEHWLHHYWMYLEVFLNINVGIPVERGTLPFHTAIPIKYWQRIQLSCIYWHQNYHWPKCSSIMSQFNLKPWGCRSANGLGLPILHEMKELKKIKKELK